MILPNVRTHLCKYRNELHGNHVSVFESRRGDEVAFDEGLISSQPFSSSTHLPEDVEKETAAEECPTDSPL